MESDVAAECSLASIWRKRLEKCPVESAFCFQPAVVENRPLFPSAHNTPRRDEVQPANFIQLRAIGSYMQIQASVGRSASTPVQNTHTHTDTMAQLAISLLSHLIGIRRSERYFVSLPFESSLTSEASSKYPRSSRRY